MATLRQFFDTDFKYVLNAQATWPSRPPGMDVIARLHFDFDAHGRFVSFYVPAGLPQPKAILDLFKQVEFAKDLGRNQVTVLGGGMVGDDFNIEGLALPFTGRVWLYTEEELAPEARRIVEEEATHLGLHLRVRGPRMAAARSKLEMPYGFLCHDSTDKETIVRSLALELVRFQCWVWYDEFTLRVGDNLREKVDAALRECRYCVVVLSKAFLVNQGWARRVFESIHAREVDEQRTIILPVWVDVTKQEVMKLALFLGDRVAAKCDEGLPEVARKLAAVMLAD